MYIYLFIYYHIFCSYRFADLFSDAKVVREVQKELDALIEAGILRLVALLLNSDAGKYCSLLRCIEILYF